MKILWGWSSCVAESEGEVGGVLMLLLEWLDGVVDSSNDDTVSLVFSFSGARRQVSGWHAGERPKALPTEDSLRRSTQRVRWYPVAQMTASYFSVEMARLMMFWMVKVKSLASGLLPGASTARMWE